MRLSDIKGENAIDVLAELMDPIVEIFSDPDVKKSYEENKIKAIKTALKGHRKAVIHMMAVLNMKTDEEYLENLNMATLPKDIFDLLNDPELESLFT